MLPAMSDELQPPAGFVRVERRSPFLDLLGPLWLRADGGQPTYGLRAAPQHANNRGAVHGGVLMTLADLVLGYTTAFASDPPLALTTAGLSVDFLGPAMVDDWIEGRAEVLRRGRSLAFATCYLTVDGRRIVRASGTFAIADAPLPGPRPG
jgi:uncharacterized protein (TIGR00369 family)